MEPTILYGKTEKVLFCVHASKEVRIFVAKMTDYNLTFFERAGLLIGLHHASEIILFF